MQRTHVDKSAKTQEEPVGNSWMAWLEWKYANMGTSSGSGLSTTVTTAGGPAHYLMPRTAKDFR